MHDYRGYDSQITTVNERLLLSGQLNLLVLYFYLDSISAIQLLIVNVGPSVLHTKNKQLILFSRNTILLRNLLFIPFVIGEVCNCIS